MHLSKDDLEKLRADIEENFNEIGNYEIDEETSENIFTMYVSMHSLQKNTNKKQLLFKLNEIS